MLMWIARSLVPSSAKIFLRRLRKMLRYRYRHLRIRLAVQTEREIKIIVGAAETYQAGWYSTNEQWLDITLGTDWDRLFQCRPILQNIVAEHVFEHLTEDEAVAALGHMYRYLLPGGRVRIAVPDGNNPDLEYIRQVGISGVGPDAADHKQLLTVDALEHIFARAGFKSSLVEGYCSNGNLICKPWLPEDGYILRSRQNEPDGRWQFRDAHTSLIVDGVKG